MQNEKATAQKQENSINEKDIRSILQHIILDIMKELAHEGLTMAVVTHEMSFAKHVSDRVVYMENGVIVEDGNPMDVLENPRSESLAKFLGKHNH